MFRVIIAGGRNFNDYNFLKEKCINILRNKTKEGITIISGNAEGADKLGEKFGQEFGIDVELYPAKWKEYGKRAGFLRNEEMSKNADALIAFWDGKSKGTKHMIDTAHKQGLMVRIINY